jgi:hypothetical protein
MSFMNKLTLFHRITFFAIVSLVILSCKLPISLQETPTPTSNPLQGSASGGSNGGNGGNQGGSNGGPNSPVFTPVSTQESTTTPDPTPPTGGPYIVKQTLNKGGETISGQVCKVTDPFVVHFVTPKVTFDTTYVPLSAMNGNYNYGYSFPSLGETDTGTGTYSLSKATDNSDALILNMVGNIHTVFKGVDTKIPFTYVFELVPSTQTTCP